MKLSRALLAIAVAGVIGVVGGAAQAQEQITGAGSTFVYPVLSRWAADYAKTNHLQVNYQAIGSGGGIAQIKAGTVDFGASDKPLTPADLAKAGLAQFPLVIGGIVPVLNVAGIKAGAMTLNGPVLADIYLGKVRYWNDKEIEKLNGGLKLPHERISVVHRSDGSGTTFNYTNYLSKVSPAWKAKVGEGTSIAWPTGVGGKGNAGVAAYVQRLKGSIGYVEYAYVLQNKMTWAGMVNSAGERVVPNAETFQVAAATADWAHAQDFHLVMTNAPGKNAYPIAATVFILMHRQPKDAARSKAALGFFRYALEKGQDAAKALDYVPFPDTVVKQIEAYWAANIQAK